MRALRYQLPRPTFLTASAQLVRLLECGAKSSISLRISYKSKCHFRRTTSVDRSQSTRGTTFVLVGSRIAAAADARKGFNSKTSARL
jgi:hypothetical protein